MLRNLLTETPDITKKGDIVYADNKALKDLTVEDVDENLIIMRQPTNSVFLPKGATWVYFMDSSASATAMKNGEMDYIMLFSGRALGNFGQVPEFEKVFTKKAKGREHILGFMQGYSDENMIRIDYMRVRTSHQRQSINLKMLQTIQAHFPNAEVTYDELTKAGKKFVKGVDPDNTALKNK